MEWIKKRYVHPNVIVRGSALVEESCRVNGLNVVQLLRPFGEFKGTLYAHTGERGAEAVAVNGFGVRFVYESCIRETDAAVRARCLRELLNRSVSTDAGCREPIIEAIDRSGLLTEGSHMPKPRPVRLSSAKSLADLTQRAGSAWHRDAVCLYHYAIRCGYFDTLDYPVGIIYLVSSRDILAPGPSSSSSSPACSRRDSDDGRVTETARKDKNDSNNNNTISRSGCSSAHTASCSSHTASNAQGVMEAFQRLTRVAVDIYTDMPSMDMELHQYFIIVHDMRFAEPSLDTAQVALAVAQRQFGPNNCALLKINSSTTPQNAGSGSSVSSASDPSLSSSVDRDGVNPAPWVEANAMRMMDVMAAPHTMPTPRHDAVSSLWMASSSSSSAAAALSDAGSIPYMGSGVGYTAGTWPSGQPMITGCYLSSNDVVELTRLVEYYLSHSLILYLERRLRALDVSVQERRTTALSKVTAWFKSRDEVRPPADVSLVRRTHPPVPPHYPHSQARTHASNSAAPSAMRARSGHLHGSPVHNKSHHTDHHGHTSLSGSTTTTTAAAAAAAATESNAAPSMYMYRAQSLELQMRRCGDVSLFLQNYAGASNYYKMCLDELIETMGQRGYNRAYLAGCQEGMALASLFLGKLPLPSLTPWATSTTHRDFKGKGAVCRLEVAHNDYLACGLTHYALRTSLLMYELTRGTVPPATRRTRAVLQYALASGELPTIQFQHSMHARVRSGSRSSSAVMQADDDTNPSTNNNSNHDKDGMKDVSQGLNHSSTLTHTTSASTATTCSSSNNIAETSSMRNNRSSSPIEVERYDEVGDRAVVYDMLAETLLFTNPPRPTGTPLSLVGLPEEYVAHAYLRQFVYYSVLAGVHFDHAGAPHMGLRCVSRALHLLGTPGRAHNWEWLYEYVILALSQMLIHVRRGVEAVTWMSVAVAGGTPSYRGIRMGGGRRRGIYAPSAHPRVNRLYAHRDHSRSSSGSNLASNAHPHRSSHPAGSVGSGDSSPSPRLVRRVGVFWQQLRRVLGAVGFALCPHMPVPRLVSNSMLAEINAYDMDGATRSAHEQFVGVEAVWSEMEDSLRRFYHAHSTVAANKSSGTRKNNSNYTTSNSSDGRYMYPTLASPASLSLATYHSPDSTSVGDRSNRHDSHSSHHGPHGSKDAVHGESTSQRHIETTLHEPLGVSVTLDNPLGMTLRVEGICLLYLAAATPSQLWKSYVSRTVELAAHAQQRVSVPFEPHEEGDYVLVGWGWRVGELEGYRYFANDDARLPMERVFASAMAHPAPRLSAAENVHVTVKPARARLRASFDPPLPHSHSSSHGTNASSSSGHGHSNVWLDGECFETSLCIHNRSRVQAAGSVVLQRDWATAHVMWIEELGWQSQTGHRGATQDSPCNTRQERAHSQPYSSSSSNTSRNGAHDPMAEDADDENVCAPVLVARQILPGATVRLRVTIRPQCDSERCDARGGCWNDLFVLVGYTPDGSVLDGIDAARHRRRRRRTSSSSSSSNRQTEKDDDAPNTDDKDRANGDAARDDRDMRDRSGNADTSSSHPRRMAGAAHSTNSRVVIQRHRLLRRIRVRPLLRVQSTLIPPCNSHLCAVAVLTVTHVGTEDGHDGVAGAGRNAIGRTPVRIVSVSALQRAPARWAVRCVYPSRLPTPEQNESQAGGGTETTPDALQRLDETHEHKRATRDEPAQDEPTTHKQDGAGSSQQAEVSWRAHSPPAERPVNGQTSSTWHEPPAPDAVAEESVCTLRGYGHAWTVPLRLGRRCPRTSSIPCNNNCTKDGTATSESAAAVTAAAAALDANIANRNGNGHDIRRASLGHVVHEPKQNAPSPSRAVQQSPVAAYEPIDFIQQRCLLDSRACDDVRVDDPRVMYFLATSHRGRRGPDDTVRCPCHTAAEYAAREELDRVRNGSRARGSGSRRVGLAFYRDGGGGGGGGNAHDRVEAERVGGGRCSHWHTSEWSGTKTDNRRIPRGRADEPYAPVGMMLQWRLPASGETASRTGWLFYFIDPMRYEPHASSANGARATSGARRHGLDEHGSHAAWRQRWLCRALLTGSSAWSQGDHAGAIVLHTRLVDAPTPCGTTTTTTCDCPTVTSTSATRARTGRRMVGQSHVVTRVRAFLTCRQRVVIAVTPSRSRTASSDQSHCGMRFVGKLTQTVTLTAGDPIATVRHGVCLPYGYGLLAMPDMRVEVTTHDDDDDDDDGTCNGRCPLTAVRSPRSNSQTTTTTTTGRNGVVTLVLSSSPAIRTRAPCRADGHDPCHPCRSVAQVDTEREAGAEWCIRHTKPCVHAAAAAAAAPLPLRWLHRPRVTVDTSGERETEERVDAAARVVEEDGGDAKKLPGNDACPTGRSFSGGEEATSYNGINDDNKNNHEDTQRLCGAVSLSDARPRIRVRGAEPVEVGRRSPAGGSLSELSVSTHETARLAAAKTAPSSPSGKGCGIGA